MMIIKTEKEATWQKCKKNLKIKVTTKEDSSTSLPCLKDPDVLRFPLMNI